MTRLTMWFCGGWPICRDEIAGMPGMEWRGVVAVVGQFRRIQPSLQPFVAHGLST